MPAARTTRLVVASALLLAALPWAARAAGDPCTDSTPPQGGSWPTYGADLRNSRSQPGEATIGIASAAAIAPAFVYDAGGAINSTPIVDGGCVFTVADQVTAARVVALDAGTGEEVWATRVPTGAAAFGGAAVGSPAVFADLVIAPFNKKGAPFVAAFDRSTGAEVWRTTLDTQPNSGINASLVVFDGMVFAGFFGNAGPGTHEQGGFVLLDALTGARLAKTFTIEDMGTPADPSDMGFEDGYSGAGIWATPAIDVGTGFAYVGTSNPHNPQKIHPRSTSILKIDLRRDSPTFARILDHYEGFRDTMVPGAEKQPACETAPGVHYVPPFSLTCLAVDVDFGSSPNLIETDDGRTLVGNLQKAGWYHVVDTDGMTGVSMTPVGIPCLACNAASTAYLGGRAFVPAGPPSQMVAVDVAAARPAWVSPQTGPTNYNAATVANGLVWAVDSSGMLNAFDVATGRPVVKRPLALDTNTSMVAGSSSSGIAVAHNTLYVAATTFVIGFRAAS